VWESGTIRPDTEPCRMRHASRNANVGARPHRREAVVNSRTALEYPHLAEALREPTRQEHRHCVGDSIGSDDPGRFVRAYAQIAGDVGYGDVGDRSVEHFHEIPERQGQRHQRESLPLQRGLGCLAHGRTSRATVCSLASREAEAADGSPTSFCATMFAISASMSRSSPANTEVRWAVAAALRESSVRAEAVGLS